MKKIETIAIIGLGALGVMYGKFIQDHYDPTKLRFLGNAGRIAKLQENPITCNDEPCDFVMIDPREEQFVADLLIVAVKATALEAATELARQVVNEDTIILSLLNGISSEEYLEETMNQGTIIKCVAQGMDAVKIGSKMTYTRLGKICLGLTPKESFKQPALDTLLKFFDAIELPYTLEEDINYRLWGKWMLNVGVNQVVMVTKGTYANVQRDGQPRDMMIKAMEEVIALAQKAGVSLTRQDLDDYLALIGTLSPEGMPSMAQDGVVKRPSEVDFFAGTVIKKAQELGVAVPTNEYLYQTVKAMESEY